MSIVGGLPICFCFLGFFQIYKGICLCELFFYDYFCLLIYGPKGVHCNFLII
jgi:hypothetical protein